MHLVILKDIVIIFGLSTLVNLVFNRIKVPTVVGYLITGIIAGPHLLSLITSREEIELMAEIGIIILLFTIGMEFSLNHLLRIRRIVFIGGLLQVSMTAGVFYLLTRFSDLGWQSGLFIGILAALSSSALVLKLLQERSELTSNYGRTVLGILIFQDILLVPLLLFTDILGESSVNISNEILLILLKASFIIGLVYVSNRWLLPKILHLIAMAKNQELFMMSLFLVCLAVALLTAQLGMSLAFGAFLAGLMISESEYSHNAFGSIMPFKDTFTSFFFVSIGMLLDLSFVLDHFLLVIGSVLILICIKCLIASATGFILGHTFRGTMLVGIALCQVGEFSFLLAKIGLDIHILGDFYYQLFLAVAVITMALTPFLMQSARPITNALMKLPLPSFLIDGLFPLQEMIIPKMKHHLVIIGRDAVALKLSVMVKSNNIQHASIIFDPATAKDKMGEGDTVIYGDAVNEPILKKASVETADIVVISVGSIITTMAIIERIRHLNQEVQILIRAKHIRNVAPLYKLGADQVLPEELEMAIDFFNRILVKRQVQRKDISRIISNIRTMELGIFSDRDPKSQPSIFDEFSNIAISSIIVEAGSAVDGKSLARIGLRGKTGVTVLAIRRAKEVIQHPVPDTVLQSKDIAYVLGDPEQVRSALALFSKGHDTSIKPSMKRKL